MSTIRLMNTRLEKRGSRYPWLNWIIRSVNEISMGDHGWTHATVGMVWLRENFDMKIRNLCACTSYIKQVNHAPVVKSRAQKGVTDSPR